MSDVTGILNWMDKHWFPRNIRRSNRIKKGARSMKVRNIPKWNEFNQSEWLRYESDIIRYYYPRLIEWLETGMKKPANIQFTSGLGRDIGRLMEDAKRQGLESKKEQEI